MPAILHLNLRREFFAQFTAGAGPSLSESVTTPGVPEHYPDAKNLLTEDCIRPALP